MRSAVLLACLVPILMGCQTSAPSYNDPAVIERCTAASGFTARAAAARAAGETGRISATPEEVAAVNACAAGQRSTTAAAVPQSSTRTVTAAGMTETYTYGTAPATPARPTATGQRRCNVLVGGAAYGCLKP